MLITPHDADRITAAERRDDIGPPTSTLLVYVDSLLSNVCDVHTDQSMGMAGGPSRKKLRTKWYGLHQDQDRQDIPHTNQAEKDGRGSLLHLTLTNRSFIGRK